MSATSNKYGRKWDPNVQVVEIEVCKYKGHGYTPTQTIQKALIRVEYLLQPIRHHYLPPIVVLKIDGWPANWKIWSVMYRRFYKALQAKTEHNRALYLQEAIEECVGRRSYDMR